MEEVEERGGEESLEGRIFSCSQPGRLSQFEAKYWPENFSRCCRKDEKTLSAD